MRIILIGATGVLGSALVEVLGRRGHDVLGVSRRGEPAVDLADPRSVDEFAGESAGADALVVCAASAPLTPFADAGFLDGLQAKLLGQVRPAQHAVERLADGGSITLTSGAIPEATTGSAGGALVNAGLNAFVRSVAVELPRGLRINAVGPGWIRETLVAHGLDPTPGVPAAIVAETYLGALEGSSTGEVLVACQRRADLPFRRGRGDRIASASSRRRSPPNVPDRCRA